MLRNNSRLMKCIEMLQMSAEMCKKPRRESISFSAMTPWEIMANQNHQNDHEITRQYARAQMPSTLFSCLVFATPALKSSPPRAPICAVVISSSLLVIFRTSFGHLLDIMYAHLVSSYIILRHLTFFCFKQWSC